jgi:murein DD-endopeptidase MepM/ murein hydrolase activator NlpD
MRRAASPRPSWLMYSAAGFLAGVLVTSAIARRPSGAPLRFDAAEPASEGVQPSDVEVRPSLDESPPAVAPPPLTSVAAPPEVSADPIEELRKRKLTLPVQSISADDIRDNFNETRGGSRRHEAIDVLAPRNTPVLAVEDGRIAKLFLSEPGGITIYQFDPTENYVYYYAHLEAYAPGLKEKDPITRGQVLGYVGTTGNAPRDAPHLHFAIFKMTSEKQWWRGIALDPYRVLR